MRFFLPWAYMDFENNTTKKFLYNYLALLVKNSNNGFVSKAEPTNKIEHSLTVVCEEHKQNYRWS
jgi:hypothetical protein